MKKELLHYFGIKDEQDLYRHVLSNEYRHLSDEYRLHRDKMADLLHTDFYEMGKSGKEYDKESILKLIPFPSMKCTVSNFTYHIEDETLICEYLLDEDGKVMECKSVWMFEEEQLRLLLFQSRFMNTV